MAGLALIVVAGVLFRKFGAPLVWYDEVAPIGLAWLTYYGGCLAALRRAHIGFPKLVDAAPPRARLGLLVARECAVVGFFALAAWAGWRVQGALEGAYLVSLGWVPEALARSVIPLGSILFIAAETFAFIERFERTREELKR